MGRSPAVPSTPTNAVSEILATGTPVSRRPNMLKHDQNSIEQTPAIDNFSRLDDFGGCLDTAWTVLGKRLEGAWTKIFWSMMATWRPKWPPQTSKKGTAPSWLEQQVVQLRTRATNEADSRKTLLRIRIQIQRENSHQSVGVGFS